MQIPSGALIHSTRTLGLFWFLFSVLLFCYARGHLASLFCSESVAFQGLDRRTMDLLCLAYLSCSRIAAAMLQRPDAALVDYPMDCPRLWPLPKSPHNTHFTFLSTVASVLLAKHAPCNSASTMQLSSAGRSTTDPCLPVFVTADRVNQISVIL